MAKGIGRQLIEQGLAWIGDNDSYLHVAPYLPARKLYEQYGFKMVSEELHYFSSNPVPHIQMIRRKTLA